MADTPENPEFLKAVGRQGTTAGSAFNQRQGGPGDEGRKGRRINSFTHPNRPRRLGQASSGK
jgi:hypothetical protein